MGLTYIDNPLSKLVDILTVREINGRKATITDKTGSIAEEKRYAAQI